MKNYKNHIGDFSLEQIAMKLLLISIQALM